METGFGQNHASIHASSVSEGIWSNNSWPILYLYHLAWSNTNFVKLSNRNNLGYIYHDFRQWWEIQHGWFKKQIVYCLTPLEFSSVVQFGGKARFEVKVRILLKDVQKELEICFKSLNIYLDKKRHSFPRYYLLSNSSLLTLLSYTNNMSSEAFVNTMMPLVSTLFNDINELNLGENFCN